MNPKFGGHKCIGLLNLIVEYMVVADIMYESIDKCLTSKIKVKFVVLSEFLVEKWIKRNYHCNIVS